MTRSAARVSGGCIVFFQAEDGIRDLTVTGVQTCALPITDAGRPQVIKPFAAIIYYGGYGRHGLNVIYNGRPLERTDYGWKRRLHPGLTFFALQGFKQTRLLTAYICPGPAVDDYVQVKTCIQYILTQIPAGVGLVYCIVKPLDALYVLTADIDKCAVNTDGITRDDRPFYNRMRVKLHKRAVLIGTWFTLIGVYGKVFRFGGILRDKTPLFTRREACAAPTSKARLIHLRHNCLGLHTGKGLLQRLIAASVLIYPQGV